MNGDTDSGADRDSNLVLNNCSLALLNYNAMHDFVQLGELYHS